MQEAKCIKAYDPYRFRIVSFYKPRWNATVYCNLLQSRSVNHKGGRSWTYSSSTQLQKQTSNSNLLVKLTDNFEQPFDFNVVVALFKVPKQQLHSIRSCFRIPRFVKQSLARGKIKHLGIRNSTHTHSLLRCFVSEGKEVKRKMWLEQRNQN